MASGVMTIRNRILLVPDPTPPLENKKTLTGVSAEVSLELLSNTQKQPAQSDMSMLDPQGKRPTDVQRLDEPSRYEEDSAFEVIAIGLLIVVIRAPGHLPGRPSRKRTISRT